MEVEIIRDNSSLEGTFGILNTDNEFFCYTLELPWDDNKNKTSCIPIGEYICNKIESPKFGKVFKVLNVQNRTDILIHNGNTISDTEGCILLGSSTGELSKIKAVLNSKHTLKTFMYKMKDIDSFVLKIKNN